MTPQHFIWLILAYADDSPSAAVTSYALMDLCRVASITVTTSQVPTRQAGTEDPVMVERVIGTIDLGTGRDGMLVTRGRLATEEAMSIIQAYADALPAHDATEAALSVTERLFGP